MLAGQKPELASLLDAATELLNSRCGTMRNLGKRPDFSGSGLQQIAQDQERIALVFEGRNYSTYGV